MIDSIHRGLFYGALGTAHCGFVVVVPAVPLVVEPFQTEHLRLVAVVTAQLATPAQVHRAMRASQIHFRCESSSSHKVADSTTRHDHCENEAV